MQIKHVAAVLALAASAAASQASTLTLTPVGDGSNFATFDGNSTYAIFDFVAANGDQLDIASLTSTWTHVSADPNLLTGYHITDVLFDGVSLTLLTGGTYVPNITTFGTNKESVTDGWTLSDTTLTGGSHTIEVYGELNLQNSKGFTGNITITPVPEPETYGMMLGGLGVLAFLARRRKS